MNIAKWAIGIFCLTLLFKILWDFPLSTTTTYDGQMGFITGTIIALGIQLVFWIVIAILTLALIGLFPPLGLLLKDRERFKALAFLIATILQLIGTTLSTYADYKIGSLLF